MEIFGTMIQIGNVGVEILAPGTQLGLKVLARVTCDRAAEE
jgi:hypothetical protein